MSNFLGVMTSLAIFFYVNARYLDISVFISLSVYAPDMLIYFRGFSGFQWPCSIRARGAKVADWDTLLTYFGFFLSCPLYLLTELRGAKDIDVGNL